LPKDKEDNQTQQRREPVVQYEKNIPDIDIDESEFPFN
jgi:hypothetical protein